MVAFAITNVVLVVIVVRRAHPRRDDPGLTMATDLRSHPAPDDGPDPTQVVARRAVAIASTCSSWRWSRSLTVLVDRARRDGERSARTACRRTTRAVS